MRVYVETGIFIDYLISRSHSASLRTSARRGRTPSDLCTDAEKCLEKIRKNHKGITSCLTYYEVEEALYAELARSGSGVSHRAKYLIPSARSVMTQVLMTVKLFQIDVLELTDVTLQEQMKNIDLQVLGIRAADALHVTTAILNNADLILSADDDILALDGRLTNASGSGIRCFDSDTSLTFL